MGLKEHVERQGEWGQKLSRNVLVSKFSRDGLKKSSETFSVNKNQDESKGLRD
jgi:hypothetical protein